MSQLGFWSGLGGTSQSWGSVSQYAKLVEHEVQVADAVTQALLVVPNVVSSGTTVLPGVGDALWTGFAPTLGLPLTLTPGVGAALYAGLAPTVGVPLTLRPGVGSGLWAGFEPTLVVTSGGGAVVILRFRYDP